MVCCCYGVLLLVMMIRPQGVLCNIGNVICLIPGKHKKTRASQYKQSLLKCLDRTAVSSTVYSVEAGKKTALPAFGAGNKTVLLALEELLILLKGLLLKKLFSGGI